MKNIINQILEIDEKARQMFIDAQKQKQDILEKAHNSEAIVKQECMDKTKIRLSNVEETQHADSEEKICEIDSRKQKRIDKLDKTYNENHIQWEKEIIANIIGR